MEHDRGTSNQLNLQPGLQLVCLAKYSWSGSFMMEFIKFVSSMKFRRHKLPALYWICLDLSFLWFYVFILEKKLDLMEVWLLCCRYGDEFSSSGVRKYSKKVKNAQEAHEAIRPTDIRRLPCEGFFYFSLLVLESTKQQALYHYLVLVLCNAADSWSVCLLLLKWWRNIFSA